MTKVIVSIISAIQSLQSTLGIEDVLDEIRVFISYILPASKAENRENGHFYFILLNIHHFNRNEIK